MATTKDIKLYGTLGTAVGKPITTTNEIYDDVQLKNQQDINADLYKKTKELNNVDVDTYVMSDLKMPDVTLYSCGGVLTEIFRYTSGIEDSDNQLWVLQNGTEPIGNNNRNVRVVYVFERITENKTACWKYVGNANLDSYEETKKNLVSSDTIYFDESVFDLMKCVFGRKNEFYDDLDKAVKEAIAGGKDSLNHGEKLNFPLSDGQSTEITDYNEPYYELGIKTVGKSIVYDHDAHEFKYDDKNDYTVNEIKIPYATSTRSGVMSAADKQKLDGISSTGEIACVSSVTYTSDATKGTLNVVNANDTTLTTEVNGATTSKAGLLSAEDKKSLDAVSALKFEIKNGVLTLVNGEDTYCVSLTPYTTPTAPSISGAGTYSLTVGAKTNAVITNKDSRTCIINYNDGTAKTITLAPGASTTIAITSTGENESMRYPISATAVCNGLSSNQTSIEIIINRQVAKPVVVIGGDKYDKSRTITATCSTSGSSIKYSTDGGSRWNDYGGSAVTVTSTTAARGITFCATASTWVNSDNSYNESQIIVGAKPVYIGFGASTLANEAAITSMEGVQKVKKDTPAGTYTVTNTNKGVYLWICSAGTLTSVKSSGFAVPMEIVQTIDDYKCYRSSSAVQIVGAQTFEVS